MNTTETPLDDLVTCTDGFLDEVVCRAVRRELDYCHWRPSAVARRHGADIRSERSPTRTSLTTGQWWFTRQLLASVAALEAELARAFGVDPCRLEPWDATHYEPGGSFDVHHDAGLWSDTPAGERTRTFLLYLETPLDGGDTHFPLLDLTIRPAVGRLVVWPNLRADGRPDPLLRHTALPVRRGRKTILTTWERERPVRSGKGAA